MIALKCLENVESFDLQARQHLIHFWQGVLARIKSHAIFLFRVSVESVIVALQGSLSATRVELHQVSSLDLIAMLRLDESCC